MKAIRWILAFGVVMAGILAARVVLANSSSFSWRMDKVQVDGHKNGRFHSLSAGMLILSGTIEITERMRSSASSPLPIRFDVVPRDSESETCSITIGPDNAVGTKKTFSERCGQVTTGTYWLRIIKVNASKPDGDGWHSRGTGTLTTQ